MAGQQSGRPKGSPTLRAVVWLQPGVDPLVLDEDGVMLETFVTLGAFVDSRLLPSARR